MGRALQCTIKRPLFQRPYRRTISVLVFADQNSAFATSVSRDELERCLLDSRHSFNVPPIIYRWPDYPSQSIMMWQNYATFGRASKRELIFLINQEKLIYGFGPKRISLLSMTSFFALKLDRAKFDRILSSLLPKSTVTQVPNDRSNPVLQLGANLKQALCLHV